MFAVVCRHRPGYDMLRQKGVSGWLVAVKADQVVHARSINHASKRCQAFFFRSLSFPLSSPSLTYHCNRVPPSPPPALVSVSELKQASPIKLGLANFLSLTVAILNDLPSCIRPGRAIKASLADT